MLIEVIKYYINNTRALRESLKLRKCNEAKLNYLAAELTRNVHSIEKGLCIENPTLGFGHKKQEFMIEQIEKLADSTEKYHVEVCRMAIDALKEYIYFHREKNYRDDFFPKIEACISKYASLSNESEVMGGTFMYRKDDASINVSDVEELFKTRHSIRDFANEKVDMEKLLLALELAKKVPSACNRQGVRVYIIDAKKNKDFTNKLSGIGGFAEAVDKFILVTGKMSAYRLAENNQYIVSASMYVAYLTLTLHLYGMGACVIQRPVIWTKEWQKTKRKFDIAEDEQMVCLLAVGNLKEECRVPLSHRFSNDIIIKTI